MSLLKVDRLKTHFYVGSPFRRQKTVIRAVDGVSFELERGETLALVGESGCGKTTAARSVLRLEEPTAGSAVFDLDGELVSIFDLDKESLRRWRRKAQMAFQDPFGSLNPRMNVADIVTEGLRIHRLCRPTAKWERAAELLESVGMDARHAALYPHEFSGGQRQRIGIARALALEPDLIAADEPVSALDVSAQAQVVNLMQDLQERMGLSYLFISHDLSVVRHIADRVAVMYLGKIVETGPKAELYENPVHPYTKALLSAVPSLDPSAGRSVLRLSGDAPSPANPPSGCAFHPRCPMAEASCANAPQTLVNIGGGRAVACHLVTGSGERSHSPYKRNENRKDQDDAE